MAKFGFVFVDRLCLLYCNITCKKENQVRLENSNDIRLIRLSLNILEPVHEKTNNLGFQPGPTQTGLYVQAQKIVRGWKFWL